QAVASDDFPVLFSHHAEERRVRKHCREHMYRNLRGWEIWLEFVLVREGCERIEADSSAHLGVGGSGAANDKCWVFADRRFRLRSHDDRLLTYLVVENRNTTGKPLP